MKKHLKFFTFLLPMSTLYCSQMPVAINASTPETTTTKDYLPDGSYIETELFKIKIQNLRLQMPEKEVPTRMLLV